MFVRMSICLLDSKYEILYKKCMHRHSRVHDHCLFKYVYKHRMKLGTKYNMLNHSFHLQLTQFCFIFQPNEVTKMPFFLHILFCVIATFPIHFLVYISKKQVTLTFVFFICESHNLLHNLTLKLINWVGCLNPYFDFC